MKNFRLLTLTIAIISIAVMIQCQNKQESDTANSVDIVSAMEKFHTLLRPLQHQAVPNNDIRAIQTNAGKLQTLAGQIQDASLPESLKEYRQKIEKLTGELFEASKALNAESDTLSDEKILAKFATVHDHYEALAEVIYTLDTVQ